MPLKAIRSLAVFGGELLANPGPVGAVAPSSPALARRMARGVAPDAPGYVVELGAGTGAITVALLERGVAPEKLVLVERSPGMVKLLRRRFPQLRVLAGDAAQLSALLGEHLDLGRQPVSHIVSSLPLRSLPRPVVVRIAAEIRRLLGPEGRYIQFTYDLRREVRAPLADFSRAATSIVWWNLPPARVNVFQC